MIDLFNTMSQSDSNSEIPPNFFRNLEYLQRISNVESVDEKEKIAKELSIEAKTPKELRMDFIKITKYLENDAKRKKKEQQKEIKLHEDFVKILESAKIQNPKSKELIQKEIELINFLKKERLFISRFYLFMASIGELLSNIENKEKLQNEINNLSMELKTGSLL